MLGLLPSTIKLCPVHVFVIYICYETSRYVLVFMIFTMTSRQKGCPNFFSATIFPRRYHHTNVLSQHLYINPLYSNNKFG
jgi:hypothetical protein